MFRKRSFILLLALLAPCFVRADEWIGLYIQNNKIGYAFSTVVNDAFKGVPCSRSDSHTLMSTKLLGADMTMDMKASTWIVKGQTKKMVFSIESAGRAQVIQALFLGKTIEVEIDNAGLKSTKSLTIPQDAPVVDDALTAMLTSKKKIKKAVFYVLDPITVSLVKNTAKLVGTEKVTVKGKSYSAQRIDIEEVRATTKVYLDAKGNLIVARGPVGIEMRPITKAEALKDSPDSGSPDLASMSAIRPDKPISDPATIKQLTVGIIGRDLSQVPSGDHQAVVRDGKGWLITVHPTVPKPGVSIMDAAKEKPSWVKASLNIPSDTKEFIDLGRSVVGDSTTVLEACDKVRDYVHQLMTPNAGIGVVRNASEVLKTKEGVCRDYAILTCAILRGAGVPARLASGIVYQNGVFYYHAWVEAWNGGQWIGVDSTRSTNRLTATHIKLAEGNVDEAFVFTFLEDSKISVKKIER